MPEKIKEILNKIVEWWKKFSTKQKILIISLSSSVLIALVILIVILSKPTMDVLVIAENTKEAVQIKNLLDSDNSIKYEIGDDNLTFRVDVESKTKAIYLLGTNDIKTNDYTINDVIDGSFSTTEADKTKKYQVYLETQLKEDLESFDNIKSAKVNLSIPVDDGTILSRNELTYASVTLTLDKELEEGQAEGLAKFVATAVGDKTTEAITILDSQMNTLFAGGDESSTAGTISKQMSAKSGEEYRIKNEIRGVMLGTNVFDNVEVGLNLVMDFTTKTIKDKKYSVADGRDEGYLTSKHAYNSETHGGSSGVPGTDSNDEDTTYVIDENNTSSSTVSDISEDYALNETNTETVDLGGSINYTDSTVSLVAISYVYYNEDKLKASGELGDQTFEEFVSTHNERKQVEVTEEYYNMVANATGFKNENISIMAYEIPYFQYSEGSERSLFDYIEIGLAVLIFLLLGFVVFRATRPEKTEELETELSVESLLESTKAAEESLEDIGYTEKSQTRLLIEKFVDENPEAAAALLRNWLEEDWD